MSVIQLVKPFDLNQWIRPVEPAPYCNDDLPKSEDEAWLMAFYQTNQNTANMITLKLEKLTKTDPETAADLEAWRDTLNIFNHNYRMTRRNPVYTDES